MDLFTKLFGDFLVFVYHCFDRIVIRGYPTALSRPELVVHFFREIVGAHSGDLERLIRSIMNTDSGDHEHPLALA